MKILVIGGTGLIGSKLVNNLRNLQHNVTAASPETGVNTITGKGLADALESADVVVDVSNSPSFDDNAVLDFFRTSTTNIIAAASRAGVKHYVAMSVVGSDRMPDSGYLCAKIAQEELIKASGLPFTILRSTQFFEFVPRIIQTATTGNEVHISPAAFQPIAASEVVEALAETVVGTPVNGVVEVAGPVRMPMYEFVRYYLNATSDSRELIKDSSARYFGAELNEESLVPGNNPRSGKTRFEDWLTSQLVAK
jgi:uncharacterized protein YbjT (DUF2867 family)